MRPAPQQNELLTDLLRQVSRSFYLTLRVLPRQVRAQIGLAYLLARTTDTIADTDVVPTETRLLALCQLRDRIQGRLNSPLNLAPFCSTQASAAERFLLVRLEEALQLLDQTAPADQLLIREVLDRITQGQALDLERFSRHGHSPGPVSLESEADLDRYTYLVAGCVGEFWTRVCWAHLPRPSEPSEALFQDAVQFGQGLQLVNILRDLPRDLRLGRCYLPERLLAASGLTPADLLKPATESRLRPLYNRQLAKALTRLAAGWSYTLQLPGHWPRVRLACAWPLLIGARTLKRLYQQPVLDPAHRVRVPRSEVYRIMLSSTLRLPFRTSWRGLFEQETRALTSALAQEATDCLSVNRP